MAKAGDEYRELVGAVIAALDPGSAVKTEQWITGPDGERDMDVEVRGALNGVPHFILVECKDHTRPIGIGHEPKHLPSARCSRGPRQGNRRRPRPGSRLTLPQFTGG
jgi:hypothetical protein